MLRIHPFRALRPVETLARELASVPYDVVDVGEAAALAAGNPYSFLHISRSEIDLPPGADVYADAVYAKAAENFALFQSKGILTRDPDPALYLYRLRMGEHVQRGLVTCCHIGDYEADLIRKHEKTRKDKEDDRTRHIATLQANTGPVFLTYRDQPDIDEKIRGVETGAPLYDFTASDGISHTLWKITDTAPFIAAFSRVPLAYIADGHHRAASSVRVGKTLREKNPRHDGTEEYNWFLAVLFPATQLQILPYNRCVKDLNGRSPDAFLDEVKRVFTVGAAPSPAPRQCRGEIHMYLAGQWHRLSWTADPAANPVSTLDVSVLQDRLLAPVLGIRDPRTDKRIDFIGGIRGAGELVQRVDSGRAAVAFSLFPVTVDALMAIADAGQIMPPKSTWFEPKLRSGLLIHTL